MTFLPIVERELRVRARLQSTYRFRMLAAGGAFVLVGLLLLAGGPTQFGGRAGLVVFNALAWLAYVFCLTDGARNTADCLSAEKREGTLGLLFLTDLKPYDVILGKLMATSLNSVYGLLAIFPPLAIPLLLGGVTFAEFWRLVLVLLNTLFFSLGVGLAVSAACRDERNAWTTAMTVLVLLSTIPTLLGLHPAWNNSTLAMWGPTTGFLHAFDASYVGAPDHFWRSLRWVHGFGWFGLLLSMFLLPRAWQDRSVLGGSWWRRFFVRQTSELSPGLPVPDPDRRAMILDGNPAVWLVVRGQRRQTLLWVVVVAATGTALAAWIVTSGATAMAVGILGMMLLIHLLLAFWVASEACHLLSGARDSGALELLLCTPLSAREVVEGHIEGLRQMFIRPVSALLTVEAVMLASQVYLLGASGVNIGFCIVIIMIVAICVAASLLDLVAAARFGLWQGLANRHPARAVTKTVLYVLILPIAGSVLLTGGLLFPIIGLVKNLVFINYAMEQMRRRFRAILTERYERF
jgi:hypothetical protein